MQLPDTLEDLTQFVLVGKTKLRAYLLKLQTVNKLSVAQEIRDQTLKETQEVSNALIAAEQRIGELLLAVPKASGQYAESENRPVSKNTIIKEMGYSKDEASDYQQMAKNPEIVQKVINDAIANGEVVTKSQVLKEIKAERDKAKVEMQDLQEERDYLESKLEELQNAEPITVPPDDYEELKQREKGHLKDYRNLEKVKDGLLDENKELKARLKELEERKDIKDHQKKLEEEAGYFVMHTLEYIRRSGGYIWITGYIDKLPESQRKEFADAVYAIDAFGKQMVENIGGYGVGGK